MKFLYVLVKYHKIFLVGTRIFLLQSIFQEKKKLKNGHFCLHYIKVSSFHAYEVDNTKLFIEITI